MQPNNSTSQSKEKVRGGTQEPAPEEAVKFGRRKDMREEELTKTQRELLESGENLSWCRPYITHSPHGRISGFAMNDGDICGITLDGKNLYSKNDEEIKNNMILLAKFVLADECPDDINDYTVSDIRDELFDKLDETGCARCPYFNICPAMFEE